MNHLHILCQTDADIGRGIEGYEHPGSYQQFGITAIAFIG